MNVTEMHIAVQQGVDKINSLQADSLLSEEIDIELNKNVFRFINTKYGRNNLYRKGFEESQKRIDDLRTLVREYEAPVTFKETLKPDSIYVDTFRLPNDYMYLVNQFSRVWINNCKPIGINYEHASELYFFTLDFNNFVCNNTDGTSTAFVSEIIMNADIDTGTSDQASIWSPSESFVTEGWTASSYPANIEALKAEILANPGPGFTIYWEEFETLNYPGQFIVIVDYEMYPWFNWDLSLGTLTYAEGIGFGGATNVYQSASISDYTYSERRIPTESSDRVTVGNRFSQQDDIFTLLEDPFNTTKYTSPLTTMRGRSIDVYTSDIFIIDTVKITYIRQPQEISLSLGIDCELPEHTHQEVVAMTVSSILEAISDPRYKSAIMEVSKNE
jgi:hypothetical protein